MSPERIIAIIGIIIIALTFGFLLYKKLPKRVQRTKFVQKWRDIQHLCADTSNWPQAILLADMLLDDALKVRGKTGKTMGERLVACQKTFSDNDAVWQAHKYANKVREDPSGLRENEVKKTLITFRQALRDLETL